MKKYFKLFASVMLAVSVYGSAYAKLPPELFNKLSQAKTLKEGKITDMVKVETMETPHATADQIKTTSYTKGSKFRRETVTTLSKGKAITSITVSDGTDAWQIVNNMKMKVGNVASQSEAAKKAQSEINNNLDNMNVLRTEPLNGKDCYVIEYAITEQGKKFNYLMWLDKESALMYQMTINSASGREQMKIVTSDYRDVLDNVKMPFITEVYQKDKLIMKTLVKSIKVNQGLADSLFDVSGYKEMSLNPFAQNSIANQAGGAQTDSGTVKNEPASPQNTEAGKTSSPLNSILKKKLPF